MRRAERSEGRKEVRGLGAVEKKLVRREGVYSLVCEENDYRVVEVVAMARWQRKNKMWERPCSVVAHRNARKHVCGRKECVEKR